MEGLWREVEDLMRRMPKSRLESNWMVAYQRLASEVEVDAHFRQPVVYWHYRTVSSVALVVGEQSRAAHRRVVFEKILRIRLVIRDLVSAWDLVSTRGHALVHGVEGVGTGRVGCA